ncbi:site-2 protease family protein [Cumulibacter manganitolerans]|uniref:site-2 protease family protein n=1 Tax=Cumulibacter manganitolerans TaxID=1884992 RepID=UPI001295ABB5|nr:site-2 protease family protein [Cumulibacter manganitolerans]
MPPHALRVARFLGAPIYVTWSWLLFVAVIVPLYTQRLDDWLNPAAAVGTAAALALMWGLSVLLHELGHVAAARLTGCEVERVEVGFLGGATSIRSADDSPERELVVAAAGPAVSIALGVPGGIGILTGSGANLGLSGVAGMFVSAVTLANLAIAAFNLLPGLPLDGGRVAVGVLWRLTGDRARAVGIASYVGQGIAAALAGWAVWRVLGAPDPVHEIPWVLILAVMSASLWSMAARSRDESRRERALAAIPLVGRLTAIDVLDGALPASALAAARTPLVLVRTADGLGYVDRSAADDAGTLGALATVLPPHRILAETASALDLLAVVREHDDPWYAVVAADGTPLGITGEAALRDR